MSFKLSTFAPARLLGVDTAFAERVCWRKTPYKSHGAAQAAIRASLRRADTCDQGDTLEPYQCPVRRDHWHIGHAR